MIKGLMKGIAQITWFVALSSIGIGIVSLIAEKDYPLE